VTLMVPEDQKGVGLTLVRPDHHLLFQECIFFPSLSRFYSSVAIYSLVRGQPLTAIAPVSKYIVFLPLRDLFKVPRYLEGGKNYTHFGCGKEIISYLSINTRSCLYVAHFLYSWSADARHRGKPFGTNCLRTEYSGTVRYAGEWQPTTAVMDRRRDSA
jgi:hypothetical protein